ncbi:MAG: prepilin peptidase [Lachnospiraceae bacterium]|nr:prepilin peptidase [Lachnospiraceae bacterium]
MALVIFFVVPAVIVDLRTSKIPNAIIVLGYVTGFLYQGICHGYYGIMQGVLGALFPLIVLFPVFVIRGLGAGDLKLLSLAGIFLSLHKSIYCLIFAIFFGGMFAVFKMLYQRNFIERIQYVIQYVREVYATGRFPKYNMETTDLKSKIHMSVPILLSVLLGLGGFY